MTMTAKREQSRKFGAYHGEDGLDPAANTQQIWTGNPCKYFFRIMSVTYMHAECPFA